MADQNETTVRTPAAAKNKSEAEVDVAKEKQLTLAEVIGAMFTLVMADRSQMPLAKYQIAEWYRSNVAKAADRKQFALDFKRQLEIAKLIGESLSSDSVTIAMNDL